jgi:hypothetical protein
MNIYHVGDLVVIRYLMNLVVFLLVVQLNLKILVMLLFQNSLKVKR